MKTICQNHCLSRAQTSRHTSRPIAVALALFSMTAVCSAQSTNADLSNLVPSAGTLSPAFDSATTSYTATVTATSITLTPTADDALATITVNGDAVASGDPSDPISLSLGLNVINTVVTAEDTVTTKTYTLTVTRAPTATTTFTGGTSTAWTEPTNWDDGVPDNSDDAWIGTGQTAVVTSANLDANPFGTLTLGTNSTLQLSAASNTGLPAGKSLYLSDGSHFQLTAGTINRTANYTVLAGATAQVSFGSNTIPQGTVTGDATTTLNYNVTGTIHSRLTNSAFAGATNYNASSGSHIVNITQFPGGAQDIVGPGTTNFGNNVRSLLQASNRIHDSGTLKLTGSSGGTSSIKFDMGTLSDTIGNFVIDSPTGATASAPTLRGSNALTVTGTTTFQGTADAVNIDTTGTTNDLLTTGNMTFDGTGTWAVSGDGRIRLNAASGTRTITTTADASISNTLTGTQGFTKEGARTLTLNGTNIYMGTATVNAGTLSAGNGTSSSALSDVGGLAVVSPAVVNLNYSGSDAVLNLSLGGSPMVAGQYGHTNSGADNGGAGVGVYDAFFAANTGVINNLDGNTSLIGVLFWDGGAVDIGTNGDAISAGGTGTWDNAILNWDSGTGAHAAWLNTSSATANFGGTAGTVTLGADMNIENLNIEVPSAGGTGYSIGANPEDNTLTFGGAKTVTLTATGAGTNQDVIIRAGIAGSPTMDIVGRNDNNASFQLLPGADVTQTIGTLNMLNTLASNKNLILGGASTGNVVDTVTWSVTGNQLFLTKRGAGGWTINNDLAFNTGGSRASRLYVEQGTLTLGGTNNFFTHKVGVATVIGSGFTATNLASKLIAKGTFTIGDNREWFFVQNAGTLSPGPGVETLEIRWNANNNTGSTNGQFNMQTGSTYEWDIASSTSTDVINVQRGGSSVGNLILGNMTIKVNDAGVTTPIAAGDQLTVFTYQTGVTRSIGTVTIDITGLGAGWSGTPSLVDNGTGTIYVTGLSFSPSGGDPEIAVEEPATFDIANGGSRNFGTVTIGSDTSLTFTIRNTGTADLNLTGMDLVAVSGTNAGDFTVTANPSTPVAASDTTTFTVQFAPGGAGARNAVLTIDNNDSDENPFTINVSGTGQTAYEDWAGGAAFGDDENGDGVSNGLAFLLGAADPDVSALGLLPQVSENNGDLVLEFDCIAGDERGDAALSVQYSNDLGNLDAWVGALVPGVVGNTTVGSVNFVATENGDLIHIVATIDSGEADAGKLFGRLQAVEE